MLKFLTQTVFRVPTQHATRSTTMPNSLPSAIASLPSALATTAAMVGALVLMASHTVRAQIYNGYQDSNNLVNDYVIIYQDCDYRGESRVVETGRYRNMKALEFRNDSISSIRVPNGFEVTIHEHDGFKGTYARIDRDISCFDREWNDQVSSIQVEDNTLRNYQDNRRDEPHNDRRDRYRDAQNDDNVTAKNITQVVFENRVLQQVNKQQWKIADARYGVAQYRETSRDSSAVYLLNDYTDEKIRIDLFANDVTLVDGNGRTERYAIQRKQSNLRRAPDAVADSKLESYRVGSNGCFRYTAYTRGGEGGVRFHGVDGFHRFQKRGHSGRICHNGVLTMEVNKTSPSTEVVVEIQGQRIRFTADEAPTAFRNQWYRKHVRLSVQPKR